MCCLRCLAAQIVFQVALDKACTPPLVEDFVVDSEEWDSLSVSLFLTKRGELYVVALEADGEDGGHPPPSPSTVRRGGDGDGGTRLVASWATATITYPDVPARLVLSGLSPELDYELYAYGENAVGGRLGRGDGSEDSAATFSVEPAPSGMSSVQVAATFLAARTAREPDEELDVPWKDLSESEQVAEALAALADPLVARAAREAALDPPTAEDLAPGRCEADPVSRNKWRSFCRWWTAAMSRNGGAGGGTERSAFLLRECIFAAQQPEVRDVTFWDSGWKGAEMFCAVSALWVWVYGNTLSYGSGTNSWTIAFPMQNYCYRTIVSPWGAAKVVVSPHNFFRRPSNACDASRPVRAPPGLDELL